MWSSVDVSYTRVLFMFTGQQTLDTIRYEMLF